MYNLRDMLRRYLRQPTFLLKTKSRQLEDIQPLDRDVKFAMLHYMPSRAQHLLMYVRFSAVRNIGLKIVIKLSDEICGYASVMQTDTIL